MRISHRVQTYVVFSALILTWHSAQAPAETKSAGATTGSGDAARQWGGQHDFDWDIGTWKVHMRRLLHPLTGSSTWVEYNGTDVVRKVSTSGTLSPPAIGEFKNGRGEFYDQEPFNGRTVLVRLGVSDITPDSCRFDQAFSADGGKTWEVNLIVTETLVKAEPADAELRSP